MVIVGMECSPLFSIHFNFVRLQTVPWPAAKWPATIKATTHEKVGSDFRFEISNFKSQIECPATARLGNTK
jgi:hypothetical protein